MACGGGGLTVAVAGKWAVERGGRRRLTGRGARGGWLGGLAIDCNRGGWGGWPAGGGGLEGGGGG